MLYLIYISNINSCIYIYIHIKKYGNLNRCVAMNQTLAPGWYLSSTQWFRMLKVACPTWIGGNKHVLS